MLRALAASEPTLAVAGDSYFKTLRFLRPKSFDPALPTQWDFPEPALRRLSEASRSGTLKLGDLLRELALRGPCDVHVAKDGWIRSRSTTYFLDRPGAVDPETVKRVFGPVVKAGGLLPELAMAAGRELTYAQAETLSAERLGFLRRELTNLYLPDMLDAWRLLDSLSEPRRRDLLDGKVVAYRSLSRVDQQAYRQFQADLSRRPRRAPLDLDLGPNDLAGVTLFLGPLGRGDIRTLEIRHAALAAPLEKVSLRARWTDPPTPAQNR